MATAKKDKEEEKDPLTLLRERMETKYGKGVIVSGASRKDFEVVSTGSLKYDKIMDCGGTPVGKLIEIYGPESSGKSTLTLHTISEFQKAGKKCVYADYEYSFDKHYAQKIGVDIDDLIIMYADTMEDGYNMIYEYIKSGKIGLIVIDSHTAMVPKQRLDGQIGDAKMAPEARINSDGLKKIKSEIEKNGCTVIGISQLRAQIGIMGTGGNQPTGGNAWKFYSDMRIKVYKILDKANEANKTTIEIAKSKCGKPFGKTEINIAWGIGIDKQKEILDLAVELGIIKKAGSWYSQGENKLGQGSEAVKELFDANPQFYEEIRKEVTEKYKDVKLAIELSDEEKIALQKENIE